MNEIIINSDLINKAKNFKIKIKRPNVTRENLPIGKHTTTWLICNFTCHNNCEFCHHEEKRSVVQWILKIIVQYIQKM